MLQLTREIDGCVVVFDVHQRTISLIWNMIRYSGPMPADFDLESVQGHVSLSLTNNQAQVFVGPRVYALDANGLRPFTKEFIMLCVLVIAVVASKVIPNHETLAMQTHQHMVMTDHHIQHLKDYFKGYLGSEYEQRQKAIRSDLQGDIDRLRVGQDELEQRLLALGARLTRKLDTIDDSVRQSEETLSRVIARVDMIADSVRQSEETLSSVIARVDTITDSVRQLEETLPNVITRADMVEGSIQQLEETLSSLIARVDMIDDSVQALERVVSSATSHRTEILSEISQTVGMLENALYGVDTRHKEFTSKTTQQLSKYETDLTGKLGDMLRRVARLEHNDVSSKLKEVSQRVNQVVRHLKQQNVDLTALCNAAPEEVECGTREAFDIHADLFCWVLGC